MDKIAEVRLFVNNIEFVTEMLTKCLDFKQTSVSKKLVTTLEMKCGTSVILYDSRSVYKEGDKILKFIIEDKYIDSLKDFLDKNESKYFYKEKHQFGIARVLNWQMDNGSMIDFSSLDEE